MSSRSARTRRRTGFAALLALAMVAALVSLTGAPASADGTETLGPPSLTLAEGTGFAAAGTGMVVQPGSIEIDVPVGATVAQVIAYWEGHHSSQASGADSTITLGGQPVSGTLIGGPTLFFTNVAGQHWSSTYRADVTALGLVSAGPNTIAAGDMAFDRINHGVGLIVIYDDGGPKSELALRDGNDLAFVNFNPTLDATVPQTFTFAASPVERTASLALFASSVAGQDFPGERPNIVYVTVDGVTTAHANPFQSGDSEEWDTFTLAVTIPAGVTELTVQPASEDPADPPSGNLPASFAWNAAALSVPLPPPADAAVVIEKYTKVVAPPATHELCAKYGKPRVLQLEYVGGNVQDHDQAPGNVVVIGNPGATDPVRIVVTNKKQGAGLFNIFNGVVPLGSTFTVDGTGLSHGRLPTNFFMKVYTTGGQLLQYVQFHTSCSQPLNLGDRYGSVVLVGYTGEKGGPVTVPVPDPNDIGHDADVPTGPIANVGDTVVWTYLVTNPEAVELEQVVVTDDNGTPGNPGDDFQPTAVLDNGTNVGDTDGDGKLDPGEEWRYTASGTAKLGQYANIGSVTAQRVDTGGPVVDDDPSHYLGTFTGDLCKAFGKPKNITFTYVGGAVMDHHQHPSKAKMYGNPGTLSPVRIVASSGLLGSGSKFFDGQVTLNSTFTISAAAGGKVVLPSATHFTLFSGKWYVQKVMIHTSCSQPLKLGDRFGSLVVTGYTGTTGSI